MSEELVDLTSKDQLMEILNKAGDKPVFIDFYATWCGKCEMLMPELEAIAEANKGKGHYLKCDIEENEDIVELYQVEALPTVILVKNKEKAGEMKGSKIENFKNFMAKELA